MSKKIFAIFLSCFLLADFVLPQIIFAAQEYSVELCPLKKISRNNRADECVIDIASPACKSSYVCYEGIVPCGKNLVTGKVSGNKCPAFNPDGSNVIMVYCQLCHFFVMIDNLIDFVLIQLIPIIAVLMLAIGGILFFFGGTKPGWIGRGKQLIKGVVIGLFLIYGAYMIVGEAIAVAGLSRHNPLSYVFYNGVFTINCPIYLADPQQTSPPCQ